MEEKNIRISQCMIVKNEEDNIGKALSWGKELMWEQIVVDTGSTDRTVELAEALGAKVCYFEWIDDFAAAKNFALEQASGDWIAFLDADEYIRPEYTGEILPLLRQAEREGCYGVETAWYCVDEFEAVGHTSKQTRFFRRIPELRYEGVVHEYLSLSNGKNFNRYLLNGMEKVIIFHTGYTPEAMEKKKKLERNERLLFKVLKEQPENYHTMGDLGDLYLSKNCQEDAEYWYREAVRRIPRTRAAQCDRNIKSFLCLMNIFREREDEAEMLKLYEDISGRFQGVYDADYILGDFYVKSKKDDQKGLIYLERAMQILEQYGTVNYGPGLIKNLPEAWEMLADCYYRNGDLNHCVVRCVGLLQADKKRTTALALLLKAFAAENPRNIIAFLSKLYDFGVEEDRDILAEACRISGSRGVLDLLLNHMKN